MGQTKTCKVCKDSKPYSEYYKNSKTKDRHQPCCKACAKNNAIKWRKKNPDKIAAQQARFYKKKTKLHHVYVLEKEHYVGSTHYPAARRSQHKVKGRYADDMRILYTTPDREEALELESLLHDLGYIGRHVNNSYQ